MTIGVVLFILLETLKMEKLQPLNVKTVIVPKGQNQYGKEVVRFTADYLSSDLYGMCIGCYPPCHSNQQGIVVISDDHSTSYPPGSCYSSPVEAHHDVDLRKATSGVCGTRDPGTKTVPSPVKTWAPEPEPAAQRRYWDV